MEVKEQMAGRMAASTRAQSSGTGQEQEKT